MRNFLLAFVFFFSCRGKENTTGNNPQTLETFELTPTYGQIRIDHRVEEAIKSFLAEDTCKGCLHEMYIDKIRPDYTIITVKSRPFSTEYLKTVNPLYQVKVAETSFTIFTGMEDIFFGDKAYSLPATDSLSNNFKVWSISIEKDSISIDRNIGAPFFPAVKPMIKPR